MQEMFSDHHTSISIGGRPICNLQFTDDIMTNSTNISVDIGMNGQKLEEITSFKYL